MTAQLPMIMLRIMGLVMRLSIMMMGHNANDQCIDWVQACYRNRNATLCISMQLFIRFQRRNNHSHAQTSH